MKITLTFFRFPFFPSFLFIHFVLSWSSSFRPFNIPIYSVPCTLIIFTKNLFFSLSLQAKNRQAKSIKQTNNHGNILLSSHHPVSTQCWPFILFILNLKAETHRHTLMLCKWRKKKTQKKVKAKKRGTKKSSLISFSWKQAKAIQWKVINDNNIFVDSKYHQFD